MAKNNSPQHRDLKARNLYRGKTDLKPKTGLLPRCKAIQG